MLGVKVSKVKASVIISGDKFDPDTVTQVLNLKSTYEGRRGEILEGRKVPNPESFWELSTGFKESWDSDEQLDSLLEKLRDKKESLSVFVKENNLTVVISLVVHIESGKAPGMGLSVEALQFAAELNARLDIDAYVMSDMSQEEFDNLPPFYPTKE